MRGKALNAYLAPIIGSDHESTEYEEGLEKLRRGMRLMIREGSSEKNLEELLPLVNQGNYHRCMLVVDDRNALDVLKEGDVDAVVRKAIRLGLDPIRAIQMASLNVAEYFRLEGLGGIAPGYHANMLVIRDLEALDIEQVYYRGRLVAEDGKALFDAALPPNDSMARTMRIKPFAVEGLALKSKATEDLPCDRDSPGADSDPETGRAPQPKQRQHSRRHGPRPAEAGGDGAAPRHWQRGHWAGKGLRTEERRSGHLRGPRLPQYRLWWAWTTGTYSPQSRKSSGTRAGWRWRRTEWPRPRCRCP